MATGSQTDILTRLQSLLPRWFGDSPTLLTALLQAYAWCGSFVYSLYAYAKLQTRIKTATDGWLDMIAADFFGSNILRKTGQTDASFLAVIIINMFRERATRTAIIKVLTDLTGRVPKVFEPLRPMDTGAYNTNSWGYGVAGGYGSKLLPFQAFVTAYRATNSGIASVGGYGLLAGGYYPSAGGYGVGQIEYASLSMIQGSVTDADIYAAIDSVKPAATIIWTTINN